MHQRVPLRLALAIVAVLATGACAPAGRFEGPPVVVATPEAAGLRLTEPLVYRTGDGQRLVVPAGTVFDGWSIPRAFWPAIGSPLEADYRAAAILHEAASELREEPWETVQRRFFEACGSLGIPPLRAKVLYGATRFGSPRWAPPEPTCYADCHPHRHCPRPWVPDLPAAEAAAFLAWIEAEDPDLEAIDRAVAERRARPTWGAIHDRRPGSLVAAFHQR